MTSKPGGASVHEVITMALVGVDLYPHHRFANAAGAIVSSRIACSDAMLTSAEVAALLEETSRA